MAAETNIIPPALLRKPILDVVEIWYWDEFNNLALDRDTDQGMPKPITTGQIQTYCNVFSIEEVDDFHGWMRLIDRVYLTEFYKREKARNATK